MSKEAFDPRDASVDEVNEYLEGADPLERERVLAVESSPEGKNRKSLVEGEYALVAGPQPGDHVEPGEKLPEDVRADASGRVLHPWEVSPKPASE